MVLPLPKGGPACSSPGATASSPPTSSGSVARDKPADRAEHTYARHVEWLREALFDRLGLTGLTVFGQDWGGLLGLRLVAEHPERVARVAVGNTGLPTGDERATDAFMAWQQFSQTTEAFNVGRIVVGRVRDRARRRGRRRLRRARSPTRRTRRGRASCRRSCRRRRRTPRRRPTARHGRRSRRFERPFLCCYSDGDAITRGADRRFRERVPGAKDQAHTTIEGGGHFLQEDRGAELGGVLATFVAST